MTTAIGLATHRKPNLLNSALDIFFNSFAAHAVITDWYMYATIVVAKPQISPRTKGALTVTSLWTMI